MLSLATLKHTFATQPMSGYLWRGCLFFTMLFGYRTLSTSGKTCREVLRNFICNLVYICFMYCTLQTPPALSDFVVSIKNEKWLQVYDEWLWLMRNRIWQVLGFLTCLDLKMWVFGWYQWILHCNNFFSQKASVNAADKLVVEHFCTQMIAIDKFVDLGELLHFSWCQSDVAIYTSCLYCLSVWFSLAHPQTRRTWSFTSICISLRTGICCLWATEIGALVNSLHDMVVN